MTAPVSSTSATPSISSTSSGSGAADNTGMTSLLQPNAFLNLLVDEMKYQNPLNPTNSSDFMSQLAQLAQVEQLTSVSSSVEISEAAALIGKSVTGYDSSGNTITGTVTGVTNSSGGPMLNVGGNSISISSVSQIGTA